ncbi:MAG: tRNA (adenosine(37)-N6)-threonylcarbamoyltransferase complex dimerization subunit type 1 TsaB [Deltaproteobacteria bacterium]|nr:tRNA (adenosine(37)-N6)-threonylcarbamoyltransferase complex dimerization subunit type 1 TsaB [Deltaproteobacteria bacterium]
MIRLSIDTAFEQLSLALSEDDSILAQYHSADRRRNASVMFQRLEDLMNHAGIKPNAIDAFVINQGPGSYTGVRIGMAFVNTLAQVFEKPVLPVNSLRLLATQVSQEEDPFRVMLNCTREELFVAEFEYQQGILKQITPIVLHHLEELKEQMTSKPFLLHRIRGSHDRWSSSFEDIESMAPDRSGVNATHLDQAAADGVRNDILDFVPSAHPLYIKRDV